MSDPSSLVPMPAALAAAPAVMPSASNATLPPRPIPMDPKRSVVPFNRRSKKGKKKSRNVGSQEVMAAATDVVELRYLAKGLMPLDDQPLELDKNNMAPGLTLSKDKLSVTGAKGYRTVRATHGASFGTWYFEVAVTRLGATGHCRLGVCTRRSDLNMPVGADQFGYSYRDMEGTKQHKGLREPFGAPFAEGDVVGVYLHMPDGGRPLEQGFSQLVRYKGSFYFKEEVLSDPQPLPGSAVAFSVNGELQGVAYSSILEGTYYPAAALFTLPEQKEGATVSFNFGPQFSHAPVQPEGMPAPQPFCEVPQANAERLKLRLKQEQEEEQQEEQEGQVKEQQQEQQEQQDAPGSSNGVHDTAAGGIAATEVQPKMEL